ncbi:hypothetical protein LGK95_21360 [Clostridium algoriphilum]|uniref:hypothetical protein n=1 Tax=Clostridium algoriphilum TaxID=198347 RepID=UPI001CF5B6C2|nr:hypothetical protein [Clostridium algoriphilum]MCB2296004.1 hypothetical protein [Clostridium algoriphilum]
MLTKEKWLSIAKEAPSKPIDRFLLTYFLGNISKIRNKSCLKRIVLIQNMFKATLIIHLLY